MPHCVNDIAFVALGAVMFLLGVGMVHVRIWLERDEYYRLNLPTDAERHLYRSSSAAIRNRIGK